MVMDVVVADKMKMLEQRKGGPFRTKVAGERPPPSNPLPNRAPKGSVQGARSQVRSLNAPLRERF